VDKKLGVLYVVDSVTRSWMDKAKKAGQALGASAADGTFAAGVNHVTELLPSLMSDILTTAPEDQKVRSLEMLVDQRDEPVHMIMKPIRCSHVFEFFSSTILFFRFVPLA
jgi:hypothetical protein